MRKIKKEESVSPMNKKRIREFESEYGLNLQELVSLYGPLFVLRLLKRAVRTKRTPKGARYTHLELPKMMTKFLLVDDKKFEEENDKFVEKVSDAGFKLHQWREPDIDEDTGKIVNITRTELYFLKKKK